MFYACDVKTKGKVPGPVANFISKSALKQATHWVKKESEADPTAEIPDPNLLPRELLSPNQKRNLLEPVSDALEVFGNLRLNTCLFSRRILAVGRVDMTFCHMHNIPHGLRVCCYHSRRFDSFCRLAS